MANATTYMQTAKESELDNTPLGLCMIKTGFPRVAVSDSLPENRERAGCAGCEMAVLLRVHWQGRLALICDKLWTKDKSCVWKADNQEGESLRGLVRISRVSVPKPTAELYQRHWQSHS
jgi:hypothetical protein